MTRATNSHLTSHTSQHASHMPHHIVAALPCPALQRLELCGGSLTDAGCAHLGKLVNLVGLSLAEVRVRELPLSTGDGDLHR
jgi:hypothetical protein